MARGGRPRFNPLGTARGGGSAGSAALITGLIGARGRRGPARSPRGPPAPGRAAPWGAAASGVMAGTRRAGPCRGGRGAATVRGGCGEPRGAPRRLRLPRCPQHCRGGPELPRATQVSQHQTGSSPGPPGVPTAARAVPAVVPLPPQVCPGLGRAGARSSTGQVRRGTLGRWHTGAVAPWVLLPGPHAGLAARARPRWCVRWHRGHGRNRREGGACAPGLAQPPCCHLRLVWTVCGLL